MKTKHYFKNLMSLLLTCLCTTLVTAQSWNEKNTTVPVASKSTDYISIVSDNIVWGFSTPNYFTKSTNGGSTFTTVTGSLPASSNITDLKALSDTVAYITLWNGADTALSGVYKTTDGGVTWSRQATALYNDPSGSFPDCIHFFDANNGVVYGDPAGGYFEVYTTTNGGTNWTRVPSASLPPMLPGEFGINNLFDAMADSVWFGTNLGRIYRSRDKGVSWQVTAMPNASSSAIFSFTDTNTGIAAYTSSTTSTLALAATNDGGATWTPISYSGGLTSVGEIEYIPGTIQLVAHKATGGSATDYFSGDGGLSWTPMNTPKGLSEIEFLNSGTGFAGTTTTSTTVGGIYKFVNTVTLIGDALVGTPWDNDLALTTTDGVTYTAANVYLNKYSPGNNLRFKFRQNKSWFYNWGTNPHYNEFPSGTGLAWIAPNTSAEAGDDIHATNYGYYNVTFNRLTGAYVFTLVSQPSIGLIGSVYPITTWNSDIDLLSGDGITYVSQNQALVTGEAKFRLDNDWAVNWGNSTFPSGTGVANGPNIPVPGGTYTITFNKNSGAYNFAPYTQTCGVIATPSNPTAVTCYGGNNGSVTITLNPIPTVAAISYSVDNGPVQNVSLTAGAFTASGLTVGNHSIVISNTGCDNLLVLVGTSGPTQALTHLTTATACNSYEWAVNGVTYTDSGTYTGTSTNGSGCSVAETLNLTINKITITAQPINTPICPTIGAVASLTVAATSLNPATYLWEYQTAATAPWVAITSASVNSTYSYGGIDTATLGITKLTASTMTIKYRVTTTDACGSATSAVAAITVLATVKAGTISSSASVCTDSNLTLTLGGYAGNSFQWQSAPDALGTFSDIAGATETTYTIVGATATTDKSYRVVVTNECNGSSATSNAKTIKVDVPSVAGTATGGGLVCSGSSGTLKVSGYTGKIQWEYSTDGENYTNAPKAADGQASPFTVTSVNSTGASYVIGGISAELYFRARVTNSSCTSDYSNVLQYTLGTVATVGTISPATTTVCSGSGTTLTLSDAVGVLSWQKTTNYAVATPTWTTLTNHTTTLLTGNLAYSTAYRVMVTIGSCSTVYSDLAYVYLVAKPVAKPIAKNTTSPTGNSATAAMCTTDASKILTIGAGYVGAIQWQKSTTSTTTGFTDIEGATGQSYTITSPAVGPNYFRASFTNSCGVQVVGATATVYYKDCPLGKSVAQEPFSAVAYPNPYANSFSLSVTTSDTATITLGLYDMIGKLVEQRAVSPAAVNSLPIGQGLASGIYNLVITQGTTIKTLRVIKQ